MAVAAAGDRPDPEDDRIQTQRVRVARWVKLGKRAGYLALLVAIVAFAIALTTDLPTVLVAVVVGGLVASAFTLLPATVVGYGLNAARREDAERAASRAAGRR